MFPAKTRSIGGPPPPSLEVDDHHAGVEIARPPPLERARQGGVRPESGREVVAEIRVAVLGRGQDLPPEVDAPQLGDVVDHDDVGVEVDDAPDLRREDLRHVDAGVVEGLVEGLPDGLRYLAVNAGGVEPVDGEVEVRECGLYRGEELWRGVDGEEMEGDVFRAGGMLEDREDRRHRAADVVGVEGHHDVDRVSAAGTAVAERRSFLERRDRGGGDGAEEEERQEAEEAEEGRRGRAPVGHPV